MHDQPIMAVELFPPVRSYRKQTKANIEHEIDVSQPELQHPRSVFVFEDGAEAAPTTLRRSHVKLMTDAVAFPSPTTFVSKCSQGNVGTPEDVRKLQDLAAEVSRLRSGSPVLYGLVLLYALAINIPFWLPTITVLSPR